jgi:hypothetical protein
LGSRPFCGFTDPAACRGTGVLFRGGMLSSASQPAESVKYMQELRELKTVPDCNVNWKPDG